MAYVETTSGANFSVAQALSTTAASSNVFDITGAGAGTAPSMIGAGGLRTALGADLGAGDGMAVPEVLITNALTTAGTGSGTLTISLEAAPDNGSYSPGSYYTLASTDAIVGTSIVAGWQLILPVPSIPPGAALPRFYRLVYTISGTVAATVNANLLLNAPLVRDATLYGNNYVAL